MTKRKSVKVLNANKWEIRDLDPAFGSILGELIKTEARDAAFDLVREKAADFVREADVSFPVMWDSGIRPSDGHNGPPVADPGVMHVHLMMDEDYDTAPIFEFSLKDIVGDMIESGGVDRGTLRLRDHFLELADFITAEERRRSKRSNFVIQNSDFEE